MEILLSFFVVVGTLLGAFIARLLERDFYEFTPILCQRLVKHAARLLKERGKEQEEEWLAHLNEVPGIIPKLIHAFGCVLAARQLRTFDDLPQPTFTSLRVEFAGL